MTFPKTVIFSETLCVWLLKIDLMLKIYFTINISGAYAFDKDSGFWLILSVPFFPAPQKQNYSYGHSQLVMGQTVLCITLDLNFMEEIGNFMIDVYITRFNEQERVELLKLEMGR